MISAVVVSYRSGHLARRAVASLRDDAARSDLALETIADANSQGVRHWHTETRAELSISASEDATTAQGWSIVAARDLAHLDAAQLGHVAIDKAIRSRNPEAIPAGDYTVVLEPAAVGQMLLFLGFLAFSGKSFAQGRGVLSGKIGEKVTGDNFTIYDDAFLPEYPGVPFDFEGTPKQKVALIENGIARGVVHDRRSASQAGVASTSIYDEPAFGRCRSLASFGRAST